MNMGTKSPTAWIAPPLYDIDGIDDMNTGIAVTGKRNGVRLLLSKKTK